MRVQRDIADPTSSDFGKDIIPAAVKRFGDAHSFDRKVAYMRRKKVQTKELLARRRNRSMPTGKPI